MRRLTFIIHTCIRLFGDCSSLLVVKVVVAASALVAVAELGVDLRVFIASYLDEIVPVHDRPYLVLQPVLLLDLLIWSNHDAFVFDLLTGSLCAVVEQRETGLLCFVLADLVLLDRALFLLADPAHVELLSLDLSTLLDFLLVSQDEQLLWHAYLLDALHVHA